MKARLLAMGGIITLLSVALVASRGVALAYGGFAIVGILLLVAGILWK
jgi:hypothetical protein